MHLVKNMFNILKIKNGFSLESNTYQFIDIDGAMYSFVSDTQVHVYTDLGIILLDLSCSIDGVYFDNINSFLTDLYI